jgi:effector-binding domain-containing protein
MMAAIRQSLSVDGVSVTALFEELEGYTARYRARAPLPPLMLYHDAEFPEQGEDIEVMVPVQKPLPTIDRITLRQLAGHDLLACLIHTGSYDSLPEAYAVLLSWIERNGYTIAGPTRELYLRFGADQVDYTLPVGYLATNDADYVTELQIPVAIENEP